MTLFNMKGWEQRIQATRSTLHDILGVRCVFFGDHRFNDIEFSARCMLEASDRTKTISYEDSTEDVMLRCASFGTERDDTRELFVEEIHFILSKLFRHVVKGESTPGTGMPSPRLRLHLDLKLFSTSLHPGIAHVMRFDQSKDMIVMMQSYAKHSLLSLSRFHTATTLSAATLGSTSGAKAKDLRLRFIIFQLLQAVAFVHEQGLCVDPVEPSHIMLDDDMWLYLPIGMAKRSRELAALGLGRSCAERTEISRKESIGSGLTTTTAAPGAAAASYACPAAPSIPRPVGYYEPLTVQWVSGKLSNFEYLMAINQAVGRTMLDPLYHPIIPWVTDFTIQHNVPFRLDDDEGVGDSHTSRATAAAIGGSNMGTGGGSSGNGVSNGSSGRQRGGSTGTHSHGWRDLTKTKFRLSKGDAQLETTYKHSDPPHHVPESLSELTYYIYLARRTPLQVLRRVVRDVFVPEHYPHSMSRIYDWTPDECIPEFFCDPTMMSSIHQDLGLADIELPPWAPTPAKFVAYHRAVLESDEVSAHLHHWIDLTFGYCLVGDAAIVNMNVPLRHTLSSSEQIGLDSPNVNKNPGFVVLFDCPHPRKELGAAAVHEHQTSSHIFSYRNSAPPDDDFRRLNPLLSLDYSSKYTTAPNELGTSEDICGIQSLVSLDFPGFDIKTGSRLQDLSGMQQFPPESSQQNARRGSTAGRLETTAQLLNQSLDASLYPRASINEEFRVGYRSPTAPSVASNRRPHSYSGSVGGSHSVSNATLVGGGATTAASASGAGSLRRGSLLSPPAEPSWTQLRSAPQINLTSDIRCATAVSGMHSQMNHFKFAMRFDTSLDAMYSYPSAPTADLAASGHPHHTLGDYDATNQVPKSTGGSCAVWDSDFYEQLLAMQYCVHSTASACPETEATTAFVPADIAGKDSEANAPSAPGVSDRSDVNALHGSQSLACRCELTAKAQADDMLAIGCMIAELYNGRPLMNRNDALMMAAAVAEEEGKGTTQAAAATDQYHPIAGKPNDACHRGIGASAGIDFVYRNTAHLPLVLRRLISLMLQPSPRTRPQAKEILQACLRADPDRWADQDFSVNRSGGYETGYVNFHQVPNTAPLDSSDATLGGSNGNPCGGSVSNADAENEAQTFLGIWGVQDEDDDKTLTGAAAGATAAAGAGGSGNGRVSINNKSLSLHRILKRYIETESRSEVNAMVRNARVELLSDYCGGVFPAYFKSVYRLVGELKLCDDKLRRLAIVLDSLDWLQELPLEGLTLTLRHLLEVLRDGEPFGQLNSSSDRTADDSATAAATATEGAGEMVVAPGSLAEGNAVAGSNSNNKSGNLTLQHCDEELTRRNEDERQSYALHLLSKYPHIVDTLGMRLGLEGTENLLVPKLVEFINSISGPEAFLSLLHSNIWNVVLLRAGLRCFLRYFLPLLLTFLSADSLQHLSIGSSTVAGVVQSGIVPMWAQPEYADKKKDILDGVPPSLVQDIQQAAMTAIIGLLETDAMGLGLGTRYLLPSLLSLIGVPQLAAAGYGKDPQSPEYLKKMDELFKRISATASSKVPAARSAEEDELGEEAEDGVERENLAGEDRGSPSAQRDLAEIDIEVTVEMAELVEVDKFVQERARFEVQDRYVMRTVTNLCMQLGDVVVAELVLSKIFNSTLVDLMPELTSTSLPHPGTIAALVEVVTLLNGILPSLQPETVQSCYLQPSRISGLSLPILLNKIPLMPSWSLLDNFKENHRKYYDLNSYINAHRRHFLHSELCRLIVSSSMIAGADACTEFVLPAVDRFFGSFVEAFGTLPIECRTMAKGFEMSAEIFLPLAQLTGAEAFYTSVPNLNPRLEMWLVSVGSNIPAKSPPLPGNIWPEATTEVENQPQKKKGLIQWITGRSKWVSSLASGGASSNTSQTTVPTAVSALTVTGAGSVAPGESISITHSPPAKGKPSPSSSSFVGAPDMSPLQTRMQAVALLQKGDISALGSSELSPVAARVSLHAATSSIKKPAVIRSRGSSIVTGRPGAAKKGTASACAPPGSDAEGLLSYASPQGTELMDMSLTEMKHQQQKQQQLKQVQHDSMSMSMGDSVGGGGGGDEQGSPYSRYTSALIDAAGSPSSPSSPFCVEKYAEQETPFMAATATATGEAAAVDGEGEVRLSTMGNTPDTKEDATTDLTERNLSSVGTPSVQAVSTAPEGSRTGEGATVGHGPDASFDTGNGDDENEHVPDSDDESSRNSPDILMKAAAAAATADAATADAASGPSATSTAADGAGAIERVLSDVAEEYDVQPMRQRQRATSGNSSDSEIPIESNTDRDKIDDGYEDDVESEGSNEYDKLMRRTFNARDARDTRDDGSTASSATANTVTTTSASSTVAATVTDVIPLIANTVVRPPLHPAVAATAAAAAVAALTVTAAATNSMPGGGVVTADTSGMRARGGSSATAVSTEKQSQRLSSLSSTSSTVVGHSHSYQAYQKIMCGKKAPRAPVRHLDPGSSGGGGGSGGSGAVGSGKYGTDSKRASARKGKSIFASGGEENSFDAEQRELYYNENAWLLAGNGRWNVNQEVRDKHAKEVKRTNRALGRARGAGSVAGVGGVSGTAGGTSAGAGGAGGAAAAGAASLAMAMGVEPTSSAVGAGNGNADWNPAAGISLTAARIATDVAADAGSLFTLGMQSTTQWKLEENPGMIKCMIANPVESLLLTCSRTGVRLWSLTSHPLVQVSSYMHHSSVPFCAGFLRCGTHAATCDGNIHIWDIESRHTIGYLSGSSSSSSGTSGGATSSGNSSGGAGSGFSSMSIIPPRYGVSPTMGVFGDDQLLTTMGSVINYYDVRSNCGKAMNPVAEWVIPQLPPQAGNFITGSAEPLQLTCAASHGHYVFAGSAGGGLWVIDRRMGKVLTSWLAHDGAIIKVNPLSDRHVLAVSERSAAVWEYQAAPPEPTEDGSPNSFYNYSVQPSSAALRALSLEQVSDSTLSSVPSWMSGTTGAAAAGGGAGVTGSGMGGDNYRGGASDYDISPTDRLRDRDIAGSVGGGGGTGGIDVINGGHSPASMDAYGDRSQIHSSNNNNSSSSAAPGSAASSSPFWMGLGGRGAVHKVLNIENMPNHLSTASTVMISALESRASISFNSMNLSQEKGIGVPSKPQHILYCISGHKLYAGRLPSFDRSHRDHIHVGAATGKDLELDELRLYQSHFVDRKGAKLTRSKLQVTSSALLPLRRLLLLGTEDGLVRVIS